MSPYDVLRSLILPLDKIDSALPQSGKIVDLGCGEGIISKFLAKSPKRQVIGVDSDIQRLPKSVAKNLKFVAFDIRKYPINKIEGAVISDVLHHLNFTDQKQLLSKIAGSLNREGVLVIKEIDKEESIRSNLSRFWDLVFYPQDKIFYWRAKDLKAYLERLRFQVKIIRVARLFPGSTTLFVCSK